MSTYLRSKILPRYSTATDDIIPDRNDHRLVKDIKWIQSFIYFAQPGMRPIQIMLTISNDRDNGKPAHKNSGYIECSFNGVNTPCNVSIHESGKINHKMGRACQWCSPTGGSDSFQWIPKACRLNSTTFRTGRNKSKR